MFTGIIEEIGCLKARQLTRKGALLSIAARKIMGDIRTGDSIAIEGVCLTVINFGPFSFDVEASEETLRKTTLEWLKVGSYLNLERAMRLDQRLGGHLVSGHIDGLGVIQKIRREGRNLIFHVYAPPEVLTYVVPKGSIAVDGISLTVNYVNDTGFLVNIIPHTAENTTISRKRVGEAVNLEADILGKYVEKFIEARFEGERKKRAGTKSLNGIDEDLLKRTGFL